jgi:transcriptional regulator with XRE-family HTH domain
VNYSVKEITKEIKIAREKKGLSQRELSSRSGVPQSHISRIEKGSIDLRLSSLIELARALELELTFVPRKVVPAVNSIVRSALAQVSKNTSTAKELKKMHNNLLNLKRIGMDESVLNKINEYVSDIERFKLNISNIEQIRATNKIFYSIKNSMDSYNELENSANKLNILRNNLVHNSNINHNSDFKNSAYSLDEEDA